MREVKSILNCIKLNVLNTLIKFLMVNSFLMLSLIIKI